MSDLVCGGIYEHDDESGKVRVGTMVCMTRDAQGREEGTIFFHGYAPEHVQADSERLSKFKLIGRPASPKVGRPRKG